MDSLPCTCNECGEQRTTKPTAKGAARLPKGWKRHNDCVYCPACWKKRYILRAVTIPVAGPVGRDWPELREALTRCWAQSTSLANWAVTELAKADVVRSPNDQQMPAMPYLYLYPQARRWCPSMPPTSVVALLHAVEQRYRKVRLSVIWRAEANLPRYRYPMPFPVHNQGWKARLGAENSPLIDLRLGESDFTLRLRSGHQYRRQLAAFGKIVSGDAIQGELSLYRQRANSGDHRPGMVDREPGGGQQICYRILAKMTVWLPRTDNERKRRGTLIVRTASDAFLIAVFGQGEPWILNVDHVRRWITQYRRMVDRIQQDTKYEKRWPKRMRRQMADYLASSKDRHHRRMTTFCHQAVAMLTGYAERQKAMELQYDDTDRSYFPEFPWFDFRQMLANKLDERGVRFVVVNRASNTNETEFKEAA